MVMVIAVWTARLMLTCNWITIKFKHLELRTHITWVWQIYEIQVTWLDLEYLPDLRLRRMSQACRTQLLWVWHGCQTQTLWVWPGLLTQAIGSSEGALGLAWLSKPSVLDLAWSPDPHALGLEIRRRPRHLGLANLPHPRTWVWQPFRNDEHTPTRSLVFWNPRVIS